MSLFSALKSIPFNYDAAIDHDHKILFREMLDELDAIDGEPPFTNTIYGINKRDCVYATNEHVYDVDACACV